MIKPDKVGPLKGYEFGVWVYEDEFPNQRWAIEHCIRAMLKSKRGSILPSSVRLLTKAKNPSGVGNFGRATVGLRWRVVKVVTQADK